jgi:hypothetical protein
MSPSKSWDELRARTQSGIVTQSVTTFLRLELPKARRLVSQLYKTRKPTSLGSLRSTLTEQIMKKVPVR